MGREIAGEDGGSSESLENRPGILLVGSPNVGKRTLLSRLISIDFADMSDLTSGVLCHGWTINTKYYSADLSIWTAHLDDEFSFGTLPDSKQLAALVMVFDMNDESSFVAIQKWVAGIDIKGFEILVCIGNKADLLPGHYAHVEYRRRLQRCGESTSDPHPEFVEYGIHETEAFSLLGDEEPSWDIRKSCLEWCRQFNIEYIEACASNADFDKCLSVDGDMQGVERLYGALSAHMWPGMILKSGNRIAEPSPVDKEEMTDESDYEVEYELLSRGSDEPWDSVGESWASFSETPVTIMEEGSGDGDVLVRNNSGLNDDTIEGGRAEVEISTTKVSTGVSSNDISSATGTELANENTTTSDEALRHEGETSAVQNSTTEVEVPEHGFNGVAKVTELEEDGHYGLEDLERVMCEIGSMRENLRLMPDFQRREMAAKLAMKMANMFDENSDEDGF